MFFAVGYAMSIIPKILITMNNERKIYNLKDGKYFEFIVSATVL